MGPMALGWEQAGREQKATRWLQASERAGRVGGLVAV